MSDLIEKAGNGFGNGYYRKVVTESLFRLAENCGALALLTDGFENPISADGKKIGGIDQLTHTNSAQTVLHERLRVFGNELNFFNTSPMVISGILGEQAAFSIKVMCHLMPVTLIHDAAVGGGSIKLKLPVNPVQPTPISFFSGEGFTLVKNDGENFVSLAPKKRVQGRDQSINTKKPQAMLLRSVHRRLIDSILAKIPELESDKRVAEYALIQMSQGE